MATLWLAAMLSEGALWAVSALWPRARFYLAPHGSRDVLVDDPELGYGMTPFYPGNDAWGYRNLAVPASTEVLAIGDSVTYGFAAPAELCWPRQLETLTSRQVYAMASGGYGPVEYSILLRRGLSLNPRTVIFGIYLGNDMSDAYASVYIHGRAPQLASQDVRVKAELAEAERRTPFGEIHALMFGTTTSEPNVGAVGKKLWNHSRLYGLFRGLYAIVSNRHAVSFGESADTQSFEESARQPERVVFDRDVRLRTVFLAPDYYVMGMNLQDPRIREGLRIVEAILVAAQSMLQEAGIRFIVAIIPTKGTVYRELMLSQPHVPRGYFDLLAAEQWLTSEFEAFLQSESIEHVNTLAALRALLRQGVRPYPQSDDTHPNAEGYRAIAEALARSFSDETTDRARRGRSSKPVRDSMSAQHSRQRAVEVNVCP